jgi:hypothetical protein
MSAKGARMRKVQRDMTIVHEKKTIASDGAGKNQKSDYPFSWTPLSDRQRQLTRR